MLLCACNNNADTAQSSSDEIKKFVMPEHGRLEEKQVSDYITIRKQIVEQADKSVNDNQESLSTASAELSGNDKDTRYFDEIEKAVANSHGMSYAEYLWIQDTIITTRTQMWLQSYYETNNKIVALLDRTLSRYGDITKEKDQLEQQKMDGYVREMKQELASLQAKIPRQEIEIEAFKHNSVVIAKFKSELDLLK